MLQNSFHFSHLLLFIRIKIVNKTNVAGVTLKVRNLFLIKFILYFLWFTMYVKKEGLIMSIRLNYH